MGNFSGRVQKQDYETLAKFQGLADWPLKTSMENVPGLIYAGRGRACLDCAGV